MSDIAESNFTMTSHSTLILIYPTLCFPEPSVCNVLSQTTIHQKISNSFVQNTKPK